MSFKIHKDTKFNSHVALEMRTNLLEVDGPASFENAAAAQLSLSTPVGVTGTQIIAFNTITFDTNGIANTLSTLTIKKAGVYSITGTADWSTAVSAGPLAYIGRITINGATIHDQSEIRSVGQAINHDLALTRSLQQGDVVRLVLVNSGSSVNLNVAQLSVSYLGNL